MDGVADESITHNYSPWFSWKIWSSYVLHRATSPNALYILTSALGFNIISSLGSNAYGTMVTFRALRWSSCPPIWRLSSLRVTFTLLQPRLWQLSFIFLEEKALCPWKLSACNNEFIVKDVPPASTAALGRRIPLAKPRRRPQMCVYR